MFGTFWDKMSPRNGLFSMAFSADKMCAAFTQDSLRQVDNALVSSPRLVDVADYANLSLMLKLIQLTGVTLVLALDDADAGAAANATFSSIVCILPSMFDASPD